MNLNQEKKLSDAGRELQRSLLIILIGLFIGLTLVVAVGAFIEDKKPIPVLIDFNKERLGVFNAEAEGNANSPEHPLFIVDENAAFVMAFNPDLNEGEELLIHFDDRLYEDVNIFTLIYGKYYSGFIKIKKNADRKSDFDLRIEVINK